MTNLTAREKGFLYVITLLIIVVLGYFFGIRNLNNKYAEYQEELKTLQDRKEYLDQLRANNASMASAIGRKCSALRTRKGSSIHGLAFQGYQDLVEDRFSYIQQQTEYCSLWLYSPF